MKKHNNLLYTWPFSVPPPNITTPTNTQKKTYTTTPQHKQIHFENKSELDSTKLKRL